MVDNFANFATADISDAHEDKIQVADPIWQHFGARMSFHGYVATVKCYEDNSIVKDILATENGDNRVLIIDAGASKRRAHLGDNLAEQAVKGGWAGIVVYGLIRDSKIINTLPIGVKALGTHPLKTQKRGEGQRDIILKFAGITVAAGNYCYADEDGIIIADKALH